MARASIHRPIPAHRASAVSTIPATARVVAVVIGLETYQTGGLPLVDYARNDAQAFATVLRTIYSVDQLDLELMVDNDATRGNIQYHLRQSIASLGEDDLFIFYYAGHGFHGAGGNRITAWDSHAHHVEETTLLLREILIDPLAESDCRRALAFVDACASGFDRLVRSRDVISDLSANELNDFLTSARYCALFLSCEPGQKSYPSDEYRHGIWTYYLLRALAGDAEEALGPGRYLTDAGLRDYLRQQVSNYLTRRTERRQRQTPQALITASNTFAIREVPEPEFVVLEAGDLRSVTLTPTDEYLEGVESGRVRSLAGFNRSRGHFEPDSVNERTTGFVRGLLANQVDEEIQELFDATKEQFGLRRSQIVRESGDAEGSLDTEFFRFSITTRLKRSDPSSYEIVRRLVLRTGPEQFDDELDATFGSLFERAVIKVPAEALDYDELADALEELEQSIGGRMNEEAHLERVTYTAPDGTSIRFDVDRGRVSLSGGGKQLPSSLVNRVRQYRFNLAGPSQFLLS